MKIPKIIQEKADKEGWNSVGLLESEEGKTLSLWDMLMKTGKPFQLVFP